jgi:hypothetical protein
MMKTLTLTLIAAALLAAQDQPNKKTPPQKAVSSKKATPQPVSIPAKATQVGPNVYRYTDAKGKVWMYARTPFGISKWEEIPEPQPQAEDQSLTTVTDLGDSVRFERKTPFGISQSVRKKTELTDDEKALLEREQNKNRPQAAETGAEKPAEKQ